MNGCTWNSQFRGAAGRYKGSLRNRAAYSGVPFPEPFTRFVRGPLLLDAAQRVFFSHRRALLPRALALAEGDEQRAGPGLFCRARILRGPLFLLRGSPPPFSLLFATYAL